MKNVLGRVFIPLLTGLLLTSFVVPSSIPVVSAAEPDWVELTDNRTATTKLYINSDDNTKYAVDVWLGPVHYQEWLGDGTWLDIDTTIAPSQKPAWDYEVERGMYRVYIKNDTTTAVVKDGNWLGFKYTGFAYYDSSSKEYEVLATPNEVVPVVTGNKIVWPNLFGGVDLEYTVTNGRFKENLYIKQATRDWLTANPPSSFGLNNQTSYLVGIVETDWNIAYPLKNKLGQLVDLTDSEHMNGLFWHHPVSDAIEAALPLGYATHEDVLPADWVNILYRFYRSPGGAHYLLFGAKVTELAQYPDGTIAIDPTIDVQPATKDSFMYEFGPDNTHGSDEYMWLYSRSGRRGRPILEFDISSIPGSQTIDSATLSLYYYNDLVADPVGRTVWCYKLDQTAWVEDEATWNSYSTGNSWTAAGGDYVTSSPAGGSTDFPASYGWMDWSIKAIVDDAYQASEDVHVLLKFETESAPNVLGAVYSSDGTPGDTSLRPKLHIEYTAAGGGSAPTVTSDNTTSVEETTVTFSGNITDVFSDNATERGFVYGAATGTYTNNITESGDFGAGTYSLGVTGLSPGTTYYWTANATSSNGTGVGSELWFTTKPNAPTGLADNARGDTWANFAWTKGTGSENTTIRWRTDTYPTDETDGTLGYSGTASSANITGLSPSLLYYVAAWAVNTDNQTVYSDSSVQDTAWTRPSDPTNLILSSPGYTTVNATWTLSATANRSMLRYRTDGTYPTGVGDGTQAYFSTGNLTTVAGLPSGTNVLFNMWFYSDNSTYYSTGNMSANMTTLATGPPVITTNPAQDVSFTTVTVNGTLTSAGGSPVTYWGQQYGIGAFTDNVSDSGSLSVEDWTLPVVGLVDGTEYQHRAFAQNSDNITYGATVNFTTLSLSAPTVVTVNASVSYFTATATGNITSIGSGNVTERGFQYGIGSFTDNVSQSGNYGTGGYSIGLAGLSDATEYQHRAYAVNVAGISYGATENFTTLDALAPTVTTANAAVGYTQATATGNITAITGENATERGFQYGIAGFTDNVNSAGDFSAGTYSIGISGLADNTEYQHRAYALNSQGISYGATVNFTTLDILIPVVVTGNATSITAATATGQGNIITLTGANATERGFQYGVGSFTSNVSSSGTFTTGNFSRVMTGLSGNTTYQYRAYAVNAAGIGYGATVNFTTSAAAATSTTGAGALLLQGLLALVIAAGIFVGTMQRTQDMGRAMGYAVIGLIAVVLVLAVVNGL